MAVSKKLLNSENKLETADKPHKYGKLSETVRKWAFFLVAHGCSQSEAASRLQKAGCKISQSSISKIVRDFSSEKTPFPIPSLTNDELIDNARKILSLYQLEVIYQKAEEKDWREIGLTQNKLIEALRNYEELKMAVSTRDQLLVLEEVLKQENISTEEKEILQRRYDRLNEKLK